MERTSKNKLSLSRNAGRNDSSFDQRGSSGRSSYGDRSEGRYSRRFDDRDAPRRSDDHGSRRFDRDGGFNRSDRSERFDRSDRRDGGYYRGERNDRFGRNERSDRRDSDFNRSDRNDRRDGGFNRAESGERRASTSSAASPWGKSAGGRGERRDSFERREREVIDVHKVFDSEVPIGRMIELEVCDISDKGAFVNAKEHGALFVPNSQLPPNLEIGNKLRVFLYMDGDRVLATARRPYIELGMTGNLRITTVKNSTAYLDLGIAKELVVPVSEQRFRMFEGDNALVYVAIDDRGRLYGTQCFNRYIREKSNPGEFKPDQRVKVVGVAHTPLGYRVIVDDSVYGLIYTSEQRGELTIGKRYEGFIRTVRDDGRLDVTLQEAGRDGIEHAAEEIMQALYFEHGHLDFNDKSNPKEIEDYLHMSKGRFKKAIGSLYKKRLIAITDNGIDLTDDGNAYCKEHFSNMTQRSADDDYGYEVADDYEGRELDDALEDDADYAYIRRDGASASRDGGCDSDRAGAGRTGSSRDGKGRKVFTSRSSDDYVGGNEDAAAAVFEELRDGNKFNKDRD